jgi:FkbM family methyltransferase
MNANYPINPQVDPNGLEQIGARLSVRGQMTRMGAALAKKLISHTPTAAGRARVEKLCCHLPDLLERDPAIILKTRFGGKMRCKSIHDLLLRRVLLFGVWEPGVTSFIETRLERGDIFVDVGANVGYYSLLASQIVGQQGSVVAVEASPSVFRDLMKNLVLNRAANVRTANIAAGEYSGPVQFYEGPPGNRGLGSAIRIEGLRPEAVVPSEPLHELLTPEEMAQTRLIKIDVEGGELPILRDLLQVLSRFREAVEIVVEIWPDENTIEVLRQFEKKGFKLFAIPNSYALEFYIRPNCRLFRTSTSELSTATADIVLSRANLEQFAGE